MANDQITIQVVDQAGAKKQAIELVVPSLYLTVRELIQLWVHQEFTKAKLAYESAPQRVKEIRKDLNGKSDMQFIWMDSIGIISQDASWELEADIACRNFQDGRFIIIAAGKQLGDLNEQIILEPEEIVQFIKLIPLIGG